jgi:hypothetical protein
MLPEVVMAVLDPGLARARSIACALPLGCVASLVLTAYSSLLQAAPQPFQKSATAPTVEASEDPHAEIKKLMGRVERRLVEIDKLLADAGASGSTGATGAQTRIERARDGGQTVVRDIDRILELADHPHPPGSA